MDELIVLQIIVGGVFVVDLSTNDIEEVKTAIQCFEYERSEMISGMCGDE